MSFALRWVLRPGDGARLAEVLERIGGQTRSDPRWPALLTGAAEQGRVFVNGRRAGPEQRMQPGDEVVVYAARVQGDGGGATLLAHAGGILVAEKPAALPTTPERRGERSLLGEVAQILATEDGRKIDARAVHAASRLDIGVSGAVLCAVGERAQRHVAAMRASGRIRRVYVGIAAGSIEGEGTWDTPIGRASTGSGRSRPIAGGRDAEPAATRFWAIAWGRGARAAGQGLGATRTTLLRCEPITGRMHQIRVHAAHAGAPLLGDRERGGPRTLVDRQGRVIPIDRITLHALAVELPGEDGKLLRAVSCPPADLRALWKALDGEDTAWDDLSPIVADR
jgi:23S rRNA-/tRNA-specific pseudouridylate synthase